MNFKDASTSWWRRTIPGIVKDVEEAFSVVAGGWCVLTKHQKEAGQDLLPPDADDYDPDGTNDENHQNYLYAILEKHGMRYAVLVVKPRE